ncbi:hypothetical protein GE09DRAFT_214901 [Coniochaeta sp. 2T2.1]|nr:hypothetical protein GE09DRAFT_214901 [Coniochaeta sp. 2T2.1]
MKQPQRNRSLVTTCSPSASSPLTSACERQPTTINSQHASFGSSSSSSDHSPTTTTPTMAHCTLSGPSTAAQLRRTFPCLPSPLVHFSTVRRQQHHRHAYTPPTTSTTSAHNFFSPDETSSSALSPFSPAVAIPLLLCRQPEPGFERDWPVPDDDVHYC